MIIIRIVIIIVTIVITTNQQLNRRTYFIVIVPISLLFFFLGFRFRADASSLGPPQGQVSSFSLLTILKMKIITVHIITIIRKTEYT